jgi:Cu(I)/Ag(I) efflux system membrane fusion protein
MAPTDEAPARGVGALVALDTQRRIATIRHGELASLDWPAMQTEFPVASSINLDNIHPGTEVAFRIARGADGILGVIDLGADDGVAATGTGMVKAVTDDGKLTLAHDAIPDIGWPPMQMDMSVAGFDPKTAPVDQPVEFDLAKMDDGTFTVVAVRAVSAPDAMMKAEEVKKSEMMTDTSLPPIVVSGTINSVDQGKRMANITHGPMMEIGMPGMTMDFNIGAEIDLTQLASGAEMVLTFERPDAASIVLTSAEAKPKPMMVSGTINVIDQDKRIANITHGPMKEIGMPGMTMDFQIAPDLEVNSLPASQEMMLLFERNDDFSLTLIGVVDDGKMNQ